jgi:hypothetical protein
MKRLSIEELDSSSTNIIIGKFTNIRSFWNSDHSTILTNVQVEVNLNLKGEIIERYITIQLLGGRIDNISTILVGAYFVKFDASKLSSGVYFYSITSGNFRQVKKMILAK